MNQFVWVLPLALCAVIGQALATLDLNDCRCPNGGANVCSKNATLRQQYCNILSSNAKSFNISSTQLRWVTPESGYLPSGALWSGYEGELNNLYICLADLLGGTIPGKLGVDVHDGLYAAVPMSGNEYRVNSYVVLVAPADSVQWVLGRSGGSVPEGAVRVGRNPGDGIPYYIGRSAFRSSLIPGKIYMSNFFAPSSGGEIFSNVYEYLVDKSQH